MPEKFEKCAPLTILFRPHAKRAAFECVAWLQASQEGLRGAILFQNNIRRLNTS